MLDLWIAAITVAAAALAVMVHVLRRLKRLDARMEETAELPQIDPEKLWAAIESIRDRNARRAAGDPDAIRECLEIDMRTLGMMRDVLSKREYQERVDAILEEYGLVPPRG